MAEGEKLIPINIDDEMKSAYIDYSMSVIVSRALPDVRDGMKPVHRRVLFGMHELGIRATGAHKKSARIVGEVLGKYHPHGDTSVYDAMVRMAQEWSLRYMLVDGQGNFGSIDGDSPAAMRYTEARMQKISEDMLADIDKDTVDHKLNFDDTLQEPTVLPTRVPGLLINGASGIAVGMATNMPPHNLTEVIGGTIAYIENNDIDVDGLMEHIKAPDFPTGGVIYGYEGVKDAFHTGRGKVVMRAKASFEEVSNRECIIVSEIPYQVNKADMIKKTADLVNEKKIEGISNIRDESDRNGMRIVYILKRDAIPNIVLNMLYKYTALQSSFSVNNICLVNGRPRLLNIKELIHYFVEHRHEVVVRRTKYLLRKAEERAHILEGLIIASDNIDEVIRLIRSSKNADQARERLIESFKLSEIQSKAIVEMRLRQLTGLEQDKLRSEYEDLMKTIQGYRDILASKELRMTIIKEELEE
ncbi:MAG: DNA topoisomerase 4 subunit A, partial [Flavobacteriaceae bacterium]|nr:DNA topoisomerase 4 subunit A [Flavobacteriaceae bacterium]